MLNTFIETYGMEIISLVVTAIFTAIGVAVKNLYTKYINDKTKKDVVETAVKATEQIYKDLHGDDKLNKAIEGASEMLMEKGITVSELELRYLIESAVNSLNEGFKKE